MGGTAVADTLGACSTIQAVGAGGNRYCTAAVEEHIRNLLEEAVVGIHRVAVAGIHREAVAGIHRVVAVGSHLGVVAGSHMDWGVELRVDPTHLQNKQDAILYIIKNNWTNVILTLCHVTVYKWHVTVM